MLTGVVVFVKADLHKDSPPTSNLLCNAALWSFQMLLSGGERFTGPTGRSRVFLGQMRYVIRPVRFAPGSPEYAR